MGRWGDGEMGRWGDGETGPFGFAQGKDGEMGPSTSLRVKMGRGGDGSRKNLHA